MRTQMIFQIRSILYLDNNFYNQVLVYRVFICDKINILRQQKLYGEYLTLIGICFPDWSTNTVSYSPFLLCSSLNKDNCVCFNSSFATEDPVVKFGLEISCLSCLGIAGVSAAGEGLGKVGALSVCCCRMFLV